MTSSRPHPSQPVALGCFSSAYSAPKQTAMQREPTPAADTRLHVGFESTLHVAWRRVPETQIAADMAGQVGYGHVCGCINVSPWTSQPLVAPHLAHQTCNWLKGVAAPPSCSSPCGPFANQPASRDRPVLLSGYDSLLLLTGACAASLPIRVVLL
jgi:hypothetical protein